MTSRRIALIGYPAEYFLPFAMSLETAGFQVYWISALTADADFLRKRGIEQSRILDVNQHFKPGDLALAECRSRLAALDSVTGPLINDIILMDRILSRKPGEFAFRYLAHLQGVMSGFLQKNQIQFASSWRDTALQILSMVLCRRLSIPWVVPTRARIPQEMYGFCTRHDTEGFVGLRPVSDADRTWAESFLSRFESQEIRPALKKSARGFGDVLRMIPAHAKAFYYEVRRSLKDMGNDYARYPVGRLVAMYLQRRINLLSYKLFPPCRSPGDVPYCLYALHTQPESSIDVVGAYFSDQIGLIRHIARSLPATHELYVKVHPTDVDGKKAGFYHEISSIPSVRLIDYKIDSRMLLSRASVLFALTGTIAYEAGLMRKPVIVFARNFFNALPTIHYCDSPPQLPTLIDRLLDLSPSTQSRSAVIDFLANLRACCYDGEVSRTYGASNAPLSQSDLLMLQRAYRDVYEKLCDE